MPRPYVCPSPNRNLVGRRRIGILDISSDDSNARALKIRGRQIGSHSAQVPAPIQQYRNRHFRYPGAYLAACAWKYAHNVTSQLTLLGPRTLDH